MNDPNARPEIGSEDISLDGYKTVYIRLPDLVGRRTAHYEHLR